MVLRNFTKAEKNTGMRQRIILWCIAPVLVMSLSVCQKKVHNAKTPPVPKARDRAISDYEKALEVTPGYVLIHTTIRRSPARRQAR